MITAKIRGGICMNAHPGGCAREVALQRDVIVGQNFAGAAAGPKTVLIIGGSTGYGLASRLTAAFGYGAQTISISYEKEASGKRSATPGWYNSRAFDVLAGKAGLDAVSVNADAFSHETRERVAELVRGRGKKIDLLIYSLASGVRPDPDTGELYRSSLKPIGSVYTTRSIDFMNGTISKVSFEPASREEIDATVKVMGGEDWRLWVDYLQGQNLLGQNFKTVAFSYIGPEVTHPIYRSGTIGQAKEHLEKTALELHDRLSGSGGEAYVSINKAVVTRASAVIPAVPLYISLLFKVMKQKGLHEGCIEQMSRLFRERLYTGGNVPVDADHLIRMDDWEMREDIQTEVSGRWETVTEETLEELADLEGFREDFLRIHGFAVPGVDYEAEVDYSDIPDIE
ncbi:MAG: enoyl-ACP reductase FabV [Spirochaetota bacterium]|nr:enoyl-ACP reductase FabV [Spirochaetota bacterium]